MTVGRFTDEQLLSGAQGLASDLLQYGQTNQIHPQDLIMVVALAERLLHTRIGGVAAHSNILDALQEAHARFDANVKVLEAN